MYLWSRILRHDAKYNPIHVHFLEESWFTIHDICILYFFAFYSTITVIDLNCGNSRKVNTAISLPLYVKAGIVSRNKTTWAFNGQNLFSPSLILFMDRILDQKKTELGWWHDYGWRMKLPTCNKCNKSEEKWLIKYHKASNMKRGLKDHNPSLKTDMVILHHIDNWCFYWCWRCRPLNLPVLQHSTHKWFFVISAVLASMPGLVCGCQKSKMYL